MGQFIASNAQDLFQIFYPLVAGATQVVGNTGFLSGSQDLKFIFRSVVDGSPASFDTGFVTGGQDLRYVFAVLGSISTPTPTATNTGTPTPTPTFTPTPTVTTTPGVTPTPTVTPGSPFVSIGVNTTNIFYGDSVIVDSTADDGGTAVTPTTHNFEVRSGPANPPSGGYTLIQSYSPSTPDDVRSFSYTPSNGAGYYQFRSYANYSGFGNVYSIDSAVVFAQQNSPPTFQFDEIFASGGTRWDSNNGLILGFIFASPGSVTITIDPGDASERFPTIVGGDLVQDFIISGGARVYTVAAGSGGHTIIVDARVSPTADPRSVSVTVNNNNSSTLSYASVRCLKTTGTQTSLEIRNVNPGSSYHYRIRNATTNSNNDSGTLTSGGGNTNINADAVGSDSIVFLQFYPSAVPLDAPSLSPTTQTPFDLNGASCNSSGWHRGGIGPVIYDGRLNYSNDGNSFEILSVNNASIDTDAGGKGCCVGAWLDLAAVGSGTGPGGSAPHSLLQSAFSFTMGRDQAGDYNWNSNENISQPGIYADYWFAGGVFIRDRNNNGFGWFFPSNFGGSNYPFHVYSLAWDDWGSNNHSIYLYRTSGNGINTDGLSLWNFSGPKIPNYDDNVEVLVYGRLPNNLNFSAQTGGRIKSSAYRNTIIWMNQID